MINKSNQSIIPEAADWEPEHPEVGAPAEIGIIGEQAPAPGVRARVLRGTPPEAVVSDIVETATAEPVATRKGREAACIPFFKVI